MAPHKSMHIAVLYLDIQIFSDLFCWHTSHQTTQTCPHTTGALLQFFRHFYHVFIPVWKFDLVLFKSLWAWKRLVLNLCLSMNEVKSGPRMECGGSKQVFFPRGSTLNQKSVRFGLWRVRRSSSGGMGAGSGAWLWNVDGEIFTRWTPDSCGSTGL